MNKFRFVLAVAGLVCLLSSSVLMASAAPVGPTNNDPFAAPFIDNAPHNLTGNSFAWYRVDYAGNDTLLTLSLVNANNSGLGFEVFTPSQLNDWWEIAPLGRGTAQQVICNTGRPADNGACQSNDLSWTTRSKFGETFYVLVTNNNKTAMDYQLMAIGDGLVMP